MTLRGQILASRTDDDPLPPVCTFTYRPHHAHMCFNMCAWCRHTRGRFECTHGGVLKPNSSFFHIFSACCNTHKHTHTHTQGCHSKHTWKSQATGNNVWMTACVRHSALLQTPLPPDCLKPPQTPLQDPPFTVSPQTVPNPPRSQFCGTVLAGGPNTE